MEFLRKDLAELRDEWELVVEKADKKVGALLKDCAQEIKDAIKEAAAVVVSTTAPQSGPDQGATEATAGLQVASPRPEAETSAKFVATGPQVQTPVIAPEPASAPESETSEEIVAVITTTRPEMKSLLLQLLSEQKPAEVETKTH